MTKQAFIKLLYGGGGGARIHAPSSQVRKRECLERLYGFEAGVVVLVKENLGG